MSVSSVKNLNGEVLSAIQDASLTNVVQTNSGKWNEISAYELASANFITAHQDLSDYQTTAGMIDYYTTAEANTLSSMLSGAIDYVSGTLSDKHTLSAGEGISFYEDDVNNITRIDCTVPGDNTAVNNVVQTYSAAGTWLTAHQSLTNYYTKTDTSSKQEISAAIPDVSNLATKSEVQTVSAAIPTLPDEEEVEFEEIDLSDYALASAIPDVSNLATKSELQSVSAAIPDTSDMATKTWVGNQGYLTSVPATYVTDTELTSAVSGLATKNELNGKQDILTGITDVQVVQALPASPVATVLYLIPEV